ncbi:MAG: glycoside hydrolase family 43 protein [Flavobacteriaceae bacterium]|nr:glycoside hydrolase family 43 protein [Flavobacteriaceae bacterium]
MKKIIYLAFLVTAVSFSQNKFKDQPLVSEIFTADPSAHIFNGKIYVYPSHDIIEKNPLYDDCGSQYAMRDYRVLSMDYIGGPVTIHDVALDLDDVPWAKRQFWAPDAAEKDGKFYLYFPTKDKDDIFRIGIAVSDKPEGPFKSKKTAIEGSYSMDPSVFKDDDGSYYMYFGGIWGGQLQRWDENNNYTPSGCETQDNGIPNSPAISPRIAKMSNDMISFAEDPKPIRIIDENGNPILTKDHDRRFFEAAWIHKRNGIYYLSYSTGNTHYIVYATGDNPYGPFTYRGVLNNPVQGWTNHHSTIKIADKWYLFYHDTQLSGKDFLRNVKFSEMTHNSDGTIETITTLID